MMNYKKYCTGCGLCKALNGIELKKDSKGFWHPTESFELSNRICPISGVHTSNLDYTDIWGRNKAVYLGWSNDTVLRNKASSGGIISEVACYLLLSKKVDEIIHVGVDLTCPTKTTVYFSKTPDDVVSHCGSRYCISSPLSELNRLEKGKKYAFIGKPCDVVALRNYMVLKPELNDNIPYLLSFFCMGLPSDDAQIKLLYQLKCEDCASLDYRGNGWPGYATAIDKKGFKHEITYNESWGKILGRDLMPACRFCIDGIGEMADIACGDAWFLTKDNKPDFSEHKGRNVIFSGTDKGEKLLQEMFLQKLISLRTYNNYKEELPLIQTSQWNRRREMSVRILAMKLLLQDYPSYNKKVLKQFSKGLSRKQNIKILFGTVKRIVNGKI